jgi:cold-inducible RNA-binding protein
VGAQPARYPFWLVFVPLVRLPRYLRFVMAKRLYVGNLPWSTTSADLEQMFAQHGSVRSAEVISDRETGRSRGFGFVEMDDEAGMNAAIQALNGTNMGGRPLTVNEAREKSPRSGGGGGGYGGGGRGGYGGGGGRGGYGRG